MFGSPFGLYCTDYGLSYFSVDPALGSTLPKAGLSVPTFLLGRFLQLRSWFRSGPRTGGDPTRPLAVNVPSFMMECLCDLSNFGI